MYISGVRITPHWFQPFSWQRKWSLNNLILRGTYKATMVNGRLNRPGSPSSKWLLIEATATEQAVATLVADHKEVGGFWRRVLDWCFLVVRFVCICQIFGVNHMIAVILVSLYHNKVGFVGVCFCRAIAVCTIVFFPWNASPQNIPKSNLDWCIVTVNISIQPWVSNPWPYKVGPKTG